MYIVYSKNKKYTGRGIEGVEFVNGVAQVKEEKKANFYKKKGFEVVEGAVEQNVIPKEDLVLFKEFKDHYQEFKEWLETPKEVEEETPKEVNFDAMKRLELDDYVAKNKIELPQECNTVDAIKKYLKGL